MPIEEAPVQYLIVDSGAFIRNAKLELIGNNIYTLPDVVNEIKDKSTKERLQVLPYTLKFREPSTDDIKLITDFSKKTGDYSTLSATDIRLLALVYLIHKEVIGTENLRKEPPCNEKVISSSSVPELNKSIIGFYTPKSQEKEDADKDVDTEMGKLTFSDKPEEDHDSSEESESDEESWITSDNLEEAQRKMGYLDTKLENIKVACLTTDFAMQNVLIQLGLSVVSLDGLLIRQTKNFILRCHACFRTTSIMTKKFCPNCGNKTLRKVAVTVNEDGTKTTHLNFRRPLNIKGTRYSLPMPKGGKHADNPILCEDQPIPQNRASKMQLTKIDVFDPAYEARSSPFAINDVYTRAGNLGIRGNVRVRNSYNPVLTSKRTGNRKNKKK